MPLIHVDTVRRIRINSKYGYDHVTGATGNLVMVSDAELIASGLHFYIIYLDEKFRHFGSDAMWFIEGSEYLRGECLYLLKDEFDYIEEN